MLRVSSGFRTGHAGAGFKDRRPGVLASWRIRGEELVVSPDLCDVFGCGLLHPRYPRPRAGQVVVPAAALADERVRPSRASPCGEPPVRANRKIAPTVISVMATPVLITRRPAAGGGPAWDPAAGTGTIRAVIS
jgi:hypothetical protein